MSDERIATTVNEDKGISMYSVYRSGHRFRQAVYRSPEDGRFSTWVALLRPEQHGEWEIDVYHKVRELEGDRYDTLQAAIAEGDAAISGFLTSE